MSDTSDAAHEDSPLFLGIDVGGTGIKIGLVDDSGKPLRKIRIDTLEEQGPEDALQRIHAACLRLLSGDPEAKNSAAATSWDRVAGIGLGTPGTMDIPNGLILTPPNLPHWRNFPIRDRLAEITGRPVAFTNDANAAAYGEFWVGSGRDHNSMIMLTLGTGVGGGIIVDGKCIEGANSFGSECGHILIDSRDDARLCVWGGGRGQLEAYASASAVAQRVHEALRAGEPSSLHDVPGGIESLTTLDLAHAGDAGDELALRILTETAATWASVS